MRVIVTHHTPPRVCALQYYVRSCMWNLMDALCCISQDETGLWSDSVQFPLGMTHQGELVQREVNLVSRIGRPTPYWFVLFLR